VVRRFGREADDEPSDAARDATGDPDPDPTTGIVECHWTNPYTLTIPNSSDPTDWTSGVYVAKLTAASSGKQSYIIFVVRDDARYSDFLYQMSVSTYQAYNNWGGKSLYGWNSPSGAAVKVSFDRPYAMGNQAISAPAVGSGEFLITVQPPKRDRRAGMNILSSASLNAKVMM